MKKMFYLLLIILCLVCIYFFSSKNGNESNQSSRRVIRNVVSLIEKITHKDLDEKRIVKTWNYPVRKIAHFTIFFILGVFMYLFISTFDIPHRMIISIVLCLICAILDESHQIFSPGRTPLLLDILIDLSGSIVGIFLGTKI